LYAYFEGALCLGELRRDRPSFRPGSRSSLSSSRAGEAGEAGGNRTLNPLCEGRTTSKIVREMKTERRDAVWLAPRIGSGFMFSAPVAESRLSSSQRTVHDNV
jgi:hypothetical protein